MQSLQKSKQTELGMIPEGWEIKKLSDIGRITGGGTPDTNKKDHWENGKIAWAVPTDLTSLKTNYIDKTKRYITQKGLDNSSAKLLPEDTILITSRATIGECAITTIPITTNQGFQNLICNSENNNLFLLYIIKFNKEKLLRKSHGTTFLEISKNNIKNLKLSIPPLKEQQKIASILSNVDELIQKTEQIIEQTQRLKKGLMQRLLTKGIGHTKFKKTELGEIPEEWKLESLGNLLKLCQYGLSLSLSEKGMYPIFRMNNIENGYMITNDFKYIDLDQRIFKEYKLEKGDILINRTNSIDLVGKLGIFLLDGDYTFASYLIRMRAIKEELNSFFLNFYLNTQKMQYKLKSLATPAVSQANINATNLKSLIIPIPSLSEQKEIVTIILNIDNSFKKYTEERYILVNLKKALMQQLLTGKIRVKV